MFLLPLSCNLASTSATAKLISGVVERNVVPLPSTHIRVWKLTLKIYFRTLEETLIDGDRDTFLDVNRQIISAIKASFRHDLWLVIAL